MIIKSKVVIGKHVIHSNNIRTIVTEVEHTVIYLEVFGTLIILIVKQKNVDHFYKDLNQKVHIKVMVVILAFL